MRAELLRSYLKYSYKTLLFSIGILILICYLTHDVIFYVLYFSVSIGREYYHYNEKLEKIKKLKAKGLTEQDLRNIEFVKKWDETRKEGLWKYCVRDGGIIAGAGLSLVVSLLYFILVPNEFKNLAQDPGNMFGFIGYAYMAGAFFGVIMYRILWSYNERRFMHLTDPLNILFASKKASFNDPA